MGTGVNPGGFDTITSNADKYVDFLDARLEIDDETRVKELIIRLLDLRDGLKVLDIGTGTGDDARRVAELVAPTGSVVGLDRGAVMVATARQRSAGTGLPIEFVEGDAQALDFADDTFDRTRAERVLIHLPDPVAAIHELVRVTRPGGLVVLSDLDGGTMFLNSTNKELASRIELGITGDLTNGWMGRQMQRHLVEAGLEDVRCVATVIQNSVAFMRIVFNHRLQVMVEAGETTDAEVAEFWAELEQGEQAGWLCSGVVCFNVVGRKPA